MATLETVRASFRKLIGVSGTDIQNTYGASGDWCMMTVWVGFNNAGASGTLCGGTKTAWVPTAWEYYKNKGLSGSSPQAGALVFFDYNSNGTPDHIEFVDSVNSDGTFNDISGNSGKSYVFEETVNMTGVLGFGYPEYTSADSNINIEELLQMQFIYQPNGLSCLRYYDGTRTRTLSHPDEVTAINMCYKQCHGTDIPSFALGKEGAPWATRFENAVLREYN